MSEVSLSNLPEIKVEFKYEQFREVLLRLKPLQQFDIYLEMETQSKLDKTKIREGFHTALQGDLSLEQITSLYSVSIFILLLDESQNVCHCNRSLEFLNECFNYTDTLKPTMIHYATVDLLETCKSATDHEEQYYVYLLDAIPHVIVASETGKMISLGLLRALIGYLSQTKIILHIYRNIWEVWQMIKSISLETILGEWSLRKSYILLKSFALLITAAALNTNSAALRQAGYRGFEKPTNTADIADWFKDLRNKLDEKHKDSKCKPGLMLVRFIDSNILSLLTEVVGNEVASEGGTEPAA